MSTDGTIERVEWIESDDVNLLLRLNDHGLSQSIVAGIASAQSPYVCVTDADMSHDIEKIPEMYRKMEEGYDLVIGTRYGKGGGIANWTFTRKVISWGANLIAKLMFPYTTDPVSGFFCIRKEIAVPTPAEPRGYKILLEYIGKSRWKSLYEIPYQFKNREAGKSKLRGNTILDYLIQVWGLVRFAWRHRDRREPEGRIWGELRKIVKFGAVGGSGIVVNTAILYALTSMLGMYLMLSSILAIETAVVTNFVLNDLWTFGEDDKKRNVFERFLMFNGVSMAGILINMAVLYVLTAFFGVYYLTANVVGIVVAFAWNFVLNRNFTFVEHKDPRVD
jgi:dolichol-phosphate mannosyltransferase